MAGLEHADGLGYVFSPDDPFVGVDIDPDLTEERKQEAIERLSSYTERSPSGKGFHVIVRAQLEGRGRHPVGIGVFGQGRYFTFTGDHLEGSPETVEYRQDELLALMDDLLPARSENGAVSPLEPQPVDLDDRELIEKAQQARRGVDFDRLMRGDWSGYPSQSEADLALCSKLAFWTGRDPDRIDRIFRASGLFREKWEREDYRTATIEEAIAGCRDVYVLKRARDSWDSGDSGFSGDSGPDDQPSDTVALQLHTEDVETFASIEEASADPILGEDDGVMLSHGGMFVFYGDGGAGKTTMELDMLFHLATGEDWLGMPVHGTSKVLVIENEGPRGMFRRKIARKLAAWDGAALTRQLYFLTDPWALFSFDEEAYREQLRLLIEQESFDVVAAGPINRLGIHGGGTPDEVGAFVFNIELVRSQLSRPVATVFAHHENKAGDVAGAWEGVPDTLCHVKANGNGSTRIHWQKARWGPTLHGKSWVLAWTEAEGFEQVDAPEVVPDEEMDERVLDWLAENPEATKRALMAGPTGNKQAIEDAIDRLKAAGRISVEIRGSSHLHSVPPENARSHRSLGMEQGIALSEGNEPLFSGSERSPDLHPPRRGEGKGTAAEQADEELGF